MQVVVTGVIETMENIQRIDDDLSRLDAPMRQATLLVTGSAKKNAPVDRGVLRASIMPGVTGSGNETKGVVGSNLVYAPVMELGSTKRWWPPLAALEVWARRHGTTAFLVARAISRRGLKGRHYLQRGLEDNAKRIVRLFNDAVGRIIK